MPERRRAHAKAGPRRVLKAAPEGVPVSHAEARQRLLTSPRVPRRITGACSTVRPMRSSSSTRTASCSTAIARRTRCSAMLARRDRAATPERPGCRRTGEGRRLMEILRRDGSWRGDLDLRRKDGATVQVGAAISTVASPVGITYRAALRDPVSPSGGPSRASGARRHDRPRADESAEWHAAARRAAEDDGAVPGRLGRRHPHVGASPRSD